MKSNYIENFLKHKHSKIIIVVMVLIIAIIVGYFLVIIQLQYQGKTNYANLQNKCSVQAEKIADGIQNGVTEMKYTHTSHYSLSLNRCYLLIHGVGITRHRNKR